MNTSTKHQFLYSLNLNGCQVLDLGCGDASYWVEILELNPTCQLYLYEPDTKVLAKAKHTFADANIKATFLSDFGSIDTHQFDLVTCFAVLEHVFDLRNFFLNLNKFLSQSGTAYINYDDGHFRDYMYKARSKSFRFRNWLKTQLWFVWKYMSWYSKYQKPVDANELNTLIEEMELRIIADTYHSLDSLELVSGLLSLESREELFPIIVRLEELLNSRLNKIPNKRLRNHSELFMSFSSRTLIIKHKLSN
jgi:SAM-dependent methyltransferase